MSRTLKLPEKVASSWIKPLVILFSISFIIFVVNRSIDFICFNFLHLGSSVTPPTLPYSIDFLGRLYNEDVGNLTNTLGGLGELVTSVLGIEITVIAIIVQLAANKYSSGIMELFLENSVNIVIIGLYVITAVNTMLVTNTISQPYIPVFSISFNFVLIILSLLIVLPHFAYVFDFLRPQNFLGYVKERITERLKILQNAKKAYRPELKDFIVSDINFLGDIALNSLAQSDRAVPLLCITYLREILIEYFGYKNKLHKNWFEMSGKEYLDPDFSSYSKFVLNSIEKKKIFLERKIFRLYEMLYDNARRGLRDVSSGVLLNSQLIAAGAIAANEKDSLRCVFQYFNSYLRIAIRERDPRSAFNTLEHYRVVAEKLLTASPDEVEVISFYFKYYGQEANKNQVFYILETAAHDLCVVNELAYQIKAPNMNNLLRLFLTLDEPLEESKDEGVSSKEMSLIGVRIAQVKLASFYLQHNEEQLARVIYEDMRVEPLNRIHKIRETIFSTKDEEFWEITPRGINFNYVPPEKQTYIDQFFSWFEEKNENSPLKKS